MQLSCMNDNGNNNVYAHMKMLVIVKKSTLNPKLYYNYNISMCSILMDYFKNTDLM